MHQLIASYGASASRSRKLHACCASAARRSTSAFAQDRSAPSEMAAGDTSLHN